MKKILSIVLALVMILSLLPGVSFAASAAENSIVDYQTVSVSKTYPSVIKNWGTRGELATSSTRKKESSRKVPNESSRAYRKGIIKATTASTLP